jgi:hypothetical protein
MENPQPFQVPPGERQLFLDDYDIAERQHLTRTMHQPAKRGAVVKCDQPWEAALETRCAPAWDENEQVFKIWLLAITPTVGVAGTSYAESQDGIHWTKPILRQAEYQGSRENNFVTLEPELRWPDNAMENVVYDPDEADPNRRYKGFLGATGRQPMVSPDGLHWERLQVPLLPSSDESNLSYDRFTHTFLATLKTGGPHGRAQAIWTSQDFKEWTNTNVVFSADDEDQARGPRNIARRFANPAMLRPFYDLPATYNVDVYNMGLFRYEGLYVGLPSMYHQTGKVPGDWPGFADWDISPEMLEIYRRDGDWGGFHHVQLTCSRDMREWLRLGDREPFLDLSPTGAGVYDLTCIIGPSYPVVRGDELWFYYTGLKAYGCPPPREGVRRDEGAICLAVLRRDGFISLDAGEQPGTLRTRPFALSGTKLCVNLQAPAGALTVEVLDEAGQVVATSAECTGDQPQAEIAWQQGDLGAVQGQPVSLRFSLRNGSFYSYWIRE